MISNFNYYRQVESPTMYLCNPDGRFLYALEASDRNLSLRFNDLSELSFTVNSAHIDKVAYGLVERRRLIFVDNIGWFQIGSVTEDTTGDVSTKNVTAYSAQITLQERNLITEDRVYTLINTNDLEDDQYDYNDPAAMPSVIGQLCKQAGVKLGDAVVSPSSEPPKITGDLGEWTIVWVTPSARFNSQGIKDDETGYNGLYTPASNDKDLNPCRSFTENSDQKAYDFIINEVEKAFNVVFEFDFLHHAIYVRNFDEVNVPTDIYISFDNLAASMSINEQTEELVTVMEVNGDGLDITNVNPMGSNYVADFEYYMKEKSEDGKVDYPWMSEGLVDTLRDWETHLKEAQEDESDDSYTQLMQRLYDQEKLKTEIDEELVYANVKVSDLEVVVQQMQTDKEEANDKALVDADGKLAKGQEYITAEEVEIGKNSLYPYSAYFKSTAGEDTTFEGDNPEKKITAYKAAPKLKETAEGSGDYIFYYDMETEGADKGTTGTPDELIKDFINGVEYKEDEDGNSSTNIYVSPLYFFDSTSEAYKNFCKLTIDTEVQAVKDTNGKLSETGTVTFEDQNLDGKDGKIVFTVTNAKITEGKFIAEEDESETSLTIGDGETAPFEVNTTYYTIGDRRYAVLKGVNSTSVRYFYVKGFARYTMYSQVPGGNGWKSLWENEQKRLEGAIEDTQSAIDEINTRLTKIAQGYDLPDGEHADENNPYKNYGCNVEYFVQRYDKDHGTHFYQELKHYWIEGEYSNENYAETEDMPFDERLSLSEELMVAAQEDLARAAKPKYETTVDAINFLRIKEFEPFIEQLELGRLITIEKSDGNYFQPALMEISYNLDTADNFSMTFSTATRPNTTSLTIADILKETSSVTKTVVSNWSELTDYSKNKDRITNLIENPLDNTLRAAIGNMVNQEFTIDKTGILGRKIERTESGDDGTVVEKFSPKQVRLINNMLIFTDDNWETSSLALGEINLDETTSAYGLIADVLIGNLVMGSQLKITNAANTITLDESGILIKAPTAEGGEEPVFQADSKGNVMLKGKIYATDGTIGGLTINDSGIGVASTETGASAFSLGFSAEGITTSGGTFGVTADGVLTAKRGTIGGLTLSENSISASNGSFSVTSTGYLTAKSGTIGGFTIGKTALYNRINSMTTSGTGVYLGTDGLNLGGNFTVGEDGTVLIKKGAMQIGKEESNRIYTLNLDEQYIVFNRKLTDFSSSRVTELSAGRLEYNAANGTDKAHGGICMSHEGSIGITAPHTVVWGYPQLKLKATSAKDSEGDSGRNDRGAYIMLYSNGDIRIVARSGGSGTLEGTWTANDFTSDSDIRLKHSVEALSDKYEGLFDMLKPVRFKYKNGISNRYHTGLIAQDVYEAIESAQLSTNDFAAYVEKKDGSLCLCYQEFIALCIAEIQRLKRAINKIKPGYL